MPSIFIATQFQEKFLPKKRKLFDQERLMTEFQWR
jgi:hypothetical protein